MNKIGAVVYAMAEKFLDSASLEDEVISEKIGLSLDVVKKLRQETYKKGV